jgi:ATP-binding cassette subfamily B protein
MAPDSIAILSTVSAGRALVAYVRPYRRTFAIGIVCVVLTTGIALGSPLVLRHAIDDLTLGVTTRKLALYGGLLLGIGLAGGVFRFQMRRLLIGASRDIEYDIRNAFFARLQWLPAAYFQAHRTGDLMSRTTSDLNAVRMMVGPAVMYSTSTVLAFVAALALMVSIDAWLALWSLIPLPLVSLSVKYFGNAIHKRFERIQAQLSEVSAVAQEALSGVRVVRAYRQEQAEIARFRHANEEYLRRNRGLVALQGLFFPSMSFLLGLGTMLVLWLGSREVILGRITLGEFVAFNAYLTMLSWPMIAFGWVTNMLQRGMASWKRMLEVLDTEPAIRDAANARAFDVRGAIEFRDLTFAYDGSTVLQRVSMRIEAGETVALVGPTGSGKSTLISLLARLYDPPPGTVFVDGVDVRDIPLAVLRGAIGFVPQEPFLFSDTLADNIAFGLDALEGAGGPGRAGQVGGAGGAIHNLQLGIDKGIDKDARMERIVAAASVARLDKDVAGFPNGYATMVGERGITLSGGQKQRTAIARAVIVDPRILILDDALSAVDTHTEEEILSRLKGVMRQRTSIIVSHRISTVRESDRIFVLDGGRIVEEGTHDQLVSLDGLYAQLHRKQLLEQELAAS